MAVVVKTSDPAGLLAAIRKAIDDKEVVTWQYDADGDFTHVPEQWKHKAWLRPEVHAGELRFRIINPKDTTLSKNIYGVYHGRFIEMLLTHFSDKFTQATATP